MHRARNPDRSLYVDSDGARLHVEVFGTGDHTVLFLPTWHIVHSRVWKMQVPYFARHTRVVTFDPRGNGKSDRPETGYSLDHFYRDVLAVLDAEASSPATLVAFSLGSNEASMVAALNPERVRRLVLIGPAIGKRGASSNPAFWARRETYERWEKYNANYWLESYDDFIHFFFGQLFSEPHSTKPTEDAISWAREADPKLLIQLEKEYDRAPVVDLLPRIECPTLVVHGVDDQIIKLATGQMVCDAIPSARLFTIEGGGHGPHLRDPVKVNLAMSEFIGERRHPRDQRQVRSIHRRNPRALYISSPIGLGHAQRDLAIARAMRAERPDLEIVWLAQHPVTRFLEESGETIHPASRELANESAHFESEMDEHDLHCFQAWREMDEILLSNFMLFHDIVRNDHYDLWLGDEAWELDYFLHENPELKAAPYVFMTDFVGWLPIDDSPGSREALVAADYNHENIRHVERYPFLRDAAMFIGTEQDVIPRRFGTDLPLMPDWIPQHFSFPGYVLPFDPADYADTEKVRRQLGLDPKRPLIVAAVGGSAVGIHLLRRIAAAFALLRRDVPEARLLLVCGPRIDPGLIEPVEDMEVVGYVHDLFRVLACCDLAVVQGGLTTTMELVANRRPFIYIPLRNHFEQNFHVVHRLRGYGAPEPTFYDQTGPARLAELMRQRLGASVDYRPVESGGAELAGRGIVSLLDERKGRGARSFDLGAPGAAPRPPTGPRT